MIQHRFYLVKKYPTILLITFLIREFQFKLKNLVTETDLGTWLKNDLLSTVSRRLGGFESK